MATSLNEAIAEFTLRRDKLLEEAEKLRAAVDRVSAELKVAEDILDNLQRAAALASKGAVESSEERNDADIPALGISQEPDELRPDEVVKLAREVLLDRGRPLKRSAIVRAIEARGGVVPGSDKSKNLGTILWRAKGAFANISGYGYWPADVHLKGIYTPD